MALGKKSKFDEHKKAELQDSKDTKTSTIRGKGKGDSEKEIPDTGDGAAEEGFDEEDYEDKVRFAAESKLYGRKNPKKGSIALKGEVDQSISQSDKPEEKAGTPTILNLGNTKSECDILWDEICNGAQGKNSGIPMGFNRLNKYLGLRKSIYTTIGAAAGCGKTSLVDCAYVLNPYDWYEKNKHTTKMHYQCVYFSMERKKSYKLAKWLCLKIFKEENKLITTDELLSWQNIIDPKKQEIAKFYLDEYLRPMMGSGIIKIIDGPQNPTGVYKYLQDYSSKQGKIEEINEFEKRYIPDNDNLITNVIIDHIGKVKLESIGGKYDKKLTVDKMSEYCSWSRDFLGYSPVVISQFNRTSYQDVQFSRKEGNDPDPTVEYWKDSGNVIEDCDVAISLFNPYKYSLEEYMKYKVEDFTDAAGSNKFRGLKIIKNSYGTDNLRIGLGFLGEVSLFKELTKADSITQKEINNVINNDFFLGY